MQEAFGLGIEGVARSVGEDNLEERVERVGSVEA